MRRGPTLAVLFGFVVGVALGCGSSKPTEAIGGGGRGGDPPLPKPADPPKPLTKDEVPAAKAKLADLEKTAAAKEKELADLKAEIETLRRSIAAAEAPKDKVYRSGPELLADMPKDAYPKFGPDAGVERAAARKWCKANLVGRTVEWTGTVKEVEISEEGPFTVTLSLHEQLFISRRTFASSLGGSFPLGSETCEVMLYDRYGLDGTLGLALRPYTCTATEADTLRKLKGKKVAFRATVTGADVTDSSIYDGEKFYERVPIVLEVTMPSVDGLLPAANKPKPKE